VSLGGRAVAWVDSEIQQWVGEVIGRRDGNALYGRKEDRLCSATDSFNALGNTGYYR